MCLSYKCQPYLYQLQFDFMRYFIGGSHTPFYWWKPYTAMLRDYP